MLKTNRNQLPRIAVEGQTQHPGMRLPGYYVGFDGKGRILPGTGGITYNYFIGDCCMGIMGDHIEPGCSTYNPNEKFNGAYNTLSCVGNIAKVISGDAKGDIGFVTGTHGGVDHVMIAFSAATLEKLTMDDRFQIQACGQGLQLVNHPDVHVMNTDPDLIDNMNLMVNDEGQVEVKVAKIIPAHLMGSGLGSQAMTCGDYDIMLHDQTEVERLGLQDLRFGDIVAITDHFSLNGPDYLTGAITIGTIVHSDSYSSGHGPGVCVMLTAKDHKIKPIIDKNANLINYLDFIK